MRTESNDLEAAQAQLATLETGVKAFRPEADKLMSRVTKAYADAAMAQRKAVDASAELQRLHTRISASAADLTKLKKSIRGISLSDAVRAPRRGAALVRERPLIAAPACWSRAGPRARATR